MSKTSCPYILAIDEGTTNAKAIAVSNTGEVLAKASRPLNIQTPQPGWVEQDGEQIWQETLVVMKEVIQHMASAPIAIAISNQRETVMGWKAQNSQPIGAAMTWQCARSAAFCEQLKQQGREEQIRTTTGLPIAPLFSASKMRWLLDHTEQGMARAQRGEILLGTMDSWLLWRLSGGKTFATDYSNAARTQLLDLQTLQWDQQMLDIFGIPASALAPIQASSGTFATTLQLPGIPDGIPILAMVGDSHAALYGHGGGALGMVKATYGTGSSVMAPILRVESILPQLATTVAWHDGERPVFGLEGNIPHTGDAVAWVCDLFGMEEQTRAENLQRIPASIESTMGTYFVPALTGLGAPYWDPQARGIFCGLSRGTAAPHLIRAALEAIAYQIADVIQVMKTYPDFQLQTLMVDGGPTRNDWLMQFQADILQCPVARSSTPELSAIGAAALAWKAALQLSDVDVLALLPSHEVFQPQSHLRSEMEQAYQGWQHAIQRTLFQPK